MHELQELVDVVTRNKVKSIRLLEPFGDQPPDMLHDFYARLANNEFANDEEAAQFYGYTSASDRGYRKQRDKLRERLTNSALFVDVSNPKFDDNQKAQFSCQKNLVIIRLLLARNARKTALDIVRNTLKFSKKYEQSEITVELLRILKSHHALKTGNKNKYLEHLRNLQHYEEILKGEQAARNLFDQLAIELVKKTTASSEYFKVAEEGLERLSMFNIKSYKFIFFQSSIKCNYYIHKCDYKNLLQQTSKTIELLRQKDSVSSIVFGHFHFLRLIAFAQLKNHPNGSACFNECLSLFEEGSVRWYNSHDIYFLILLRTKNYEDLITIHNRIINHPSFTRQTQKRRETWKTYEAYIQYLIINGKVDIGDGISTLRYSINKFLNEVPMFSMDKGGYNIPIVVIQNLLLIKLRQYEELTTRTSALEKYCKRYIKRNDNFRSHYFFKLLLLVPKFNFDRDVIKAKAKPYLKKLESVPLSEAKQSFEIEIIPYETLWEYVLESLD